MREVIGIEVSAADRERLAAVVGDGNVCRSTFGGRGLFWRQGRLRRGRDLAPRRGFESPVWHWEERFMREGVAGLLRKKTREPGLPPLPPALVNVGALTLNDLHGEAAQSVGRASRT